MTTIDNEIEIIILPGRHEAPPQTAHLTMEERVGISKLIGGGKLAEMIEVELMNYRQASDHHTFEQRTISAITRAVRKRLSEISKHTTEPATTVAGCCR